MINVTNETLIEFRGPFISRWGSVEDTEVMNSERHLLE